MDDSILRSSIATRIRATMWSMPLANDRKREIRAKSMQGTVLLALGILAGVGAAFTGMIWLAGLALGLLVSAVVVLYQVGKSLP